MEDIGVNAARTALLFFDMIKAHAYDTDLRSVIPAARSQVDACVRIMNTARELGVPIVYVQPDHRPDGRERGTILTDVDLERHTPAGGGVVSGAPGAQVIDEIAPGPDDYRIYKHRWSAFFQTELELSLRARDIDTILLAGVSSEVGIGSTAYAARDMDFNVVFLRDCLRSARDQSVSDYCADHVFPHVGRVRTVAQTDALLRGGRPTGAGSAPAPRGLARVDPRARPQTVHDPEIDPREAGLLFFDIMKGYEYDRDLRGPTAEARPLLQSCERMLRVARGRGMPVFYAQPHHRKDGGDWSPAVTDHNLHRLETAFGKVRLRPLLLQGEPGTEVVDELAPRPEDYRILKHRWSAFYETPLELSLRTAGVKTILLAGGASEIGIISTAYAARDLDFNVVILRDACSSSYPEMQDFLMDRVFPRMSRIRTIEQVSGLLRAMT